jgi:hypothetical protein
LVLPLELIPTECGVDGARKAHVVGRLSELVPAEV